MFDSICSSPPPEIYLEMWIAADAWERLERSGRRLHFVSGPAAHRAHAEVHDLDGNVLSDASPSEALQMAAGALDGC